MLAYIKVILIVVFIIVGLIYDWGGVINHPGPGLSNFNDNPFANGFAGTAQSFTYAFYSVSLASSLPRSEMCTYRHPVL